VSADPAIVDRLLDAIRDIGEDRLRLLMPVVRDVSARIAGARA